MTPSRIAYVVKVFPKLSETFIANELVELQRRGIEVRVLSLLRPAAGIRHQMIAQATLDAITHYEPSQFRPVLEEFRPQLIHAHFATEATEQALELAEDFGLPFTFTAHGYDIRRRPPEDFAERAAAAAAVITVSQANARHLVEHLGVPASRIRVVPCGVDVERFRPLLEGAEELRPPLIVCVARHVQVKNLGLLLQACDLLRRQGVNFRCALVGDGPCRGELEALRARLGLEQRVEFVGAAEQSDVIAWWQRAAVAALSSEEEGMPVSLMEAAACGVPGVGTAVGGVPELIVDGATGLLVPSGDAPALAAALQRLIDDPALRRRLGQAARNRAVDCFSLKQQVERLLGLWSGCRPNQRPLHYTVSDPFDAALDPGLPTLKLALDPVMAGREFKHALPRLATAHGRVHLKAIRVVRYKPGRRCLVECEIRVFHPGKCVERATLIGKVRARRYGNEAFRLAEAFWNAGFQGESKDGISVPEPVGVVPGLRMWLQRKVPGKSAMTRLVKRDGVALARRIAEAIHKLHRAGVPTEKSHAMTDELRILHERLPQVAREQPQHRERLERILRASDQLGASVPPPRACGIHRDFYPGQVIVDGSRLYLVDFDLYCQGDPGLDVGNFIGHMIEESLRVQSNPSALRDREQALEERFVELSGEHTRVAVSAYTTLTLVRHIYLSTQFPDRTALLEPLMDLCEDRLAAARPA